MSQKKKFVYVCISILLMGMLLACGASAVIPTSTNPPPPPTMTPWPTPTPIPTDTPVPPPNFAGRWLDPDTSGTITTIEAQRDGFAVISILNPNRGLNELSWSSWEDGVLSWEYCPPDMYCITSQTVSVSEDTLVADWWWTDGGNGDTTYYSRVP